MIVTEYFDEATLINMFGQEPYRVDRPEINEAAPNNFLENLFLPEEERKISNLFIRIKERKILKNIPFQS
jgi:hypothetical protein